MRVQRHITVTQKPAKPAQPKAEKPRIKGEAKAYSFFQDVFDVVRQIPKGRATTYGAIANYIGTKLSARMVGWAMGASVYAKPKVPAHRVVNRVGLLSGKMHFGSADEMQKRLEKEKIKVEKDKVVDFDKLFWDPAEELIL